MFLMSHRTYQLFFLYSADRFLQYKQSICCYYYFEKFIIVSRERKIGLFVWPQFTNRMKREVDGICDFAPFIMRRLREYN